MALAPQDEMSKKLAELSEAKAPVLGLPPQTTPIPLKSAMSEDKETPPQAPDES